MVNREANGLIVDRPYKRQSLYRALKYGIPAFITSAALAACGGKANSSSVTSSPTHDASATTPLVKTKPGPKVLLKGSSHVEIEQAAGGAETLANYINASGQGPTIPYKARITVDCLATGPLSAAPSAHGNLHPVKLPNGIIEKTDHGAKWYHITGPDEYAGYFTASNAYENGDTTGPLSSQPAEDYKVPPCP